MAVEIMSDLLEVAIVLYPVALVYGLQMQTSEKIQVIVGFGLRFP